MCAGEDGCPNPPEPRNPVTEADFMKPLVQFLEYHHYDDLDSILIRGENLWFLHQVRIARNLLTQPRDVNSNLVQFSCPLTAAIPPQLSSSSEASASADVEAFSHFSDPVSCSVPVSHKVSCCTVQIGVRQFAGICPCEFHRLIAITLTLTCRNSPCWQSCECCN